MKRLLRLHPEDNVAVAVDGAKAHETVACGDLVFSAMQTIPPLHKVALAPIDEGDPVIRYGHPIGLAMQRIASGEWVHTHNVRSCVDERLAVTVEDIPDSGAPDPSFSKPSDLAGRVTFEGFRRSTGEVGVRNELWIIPLVGCVNKTAERIAKRFEAECLPGVEGVRVWTHPYGCSQLGGDHRRTQQLLASLAKHPNAAGVLLLGLGCEENTWKTFEPLLEGADRRRVRHLLCQEVSDEEMTGVELLGELATIAVDDHREPCDLSELVVGVKCGGSDALSGVTANPLVGRVAGRIVQSGGSVIMTETPEMFGAEQALFSQCIDREVLDRACRMAQSFRDYFVANGQPVDENPSPGNVQGGITTLAEKSLGCVTKAGTGPITDVIDYGRRVTRSGVTLLDGPGNDMVAVTALAAAGAQVILFTTGRGTPLGGPVPTVKIATNTQLAGNKPHWIDYDAGMLLTADDWSHATDELLQLVLRVASGEQHARNEVNNEREIAIWRDGVTL